MISCRPLWRCSAVDTRDKWRRPVFVVFSVSPFHRERNTTVSKFTSELVLTPENATNYIIIVLMILYSRRTFRDCPVTPLLRNDVTVKPHLSHFGHLPIHRCLLLLEMPSVILPVNNTLSYFIEAFPLLSTVVHWRNVHLRECAALSTDWRWTERTTGASIMCHFTQRLRAVLPECRVCGCSSWHRESRALVALSHWNIHSLCMKIFGQKGWVLYKIIWDFTNIYTNSWKDHTASQASSWIGQTVNVTGGSVNLQYNYIFRFEISFNWKC